jgi:hypothetical protein
MGAIVGGVIGGAAVGTKIAKLFLLYETDKTTGNSGYVSATLKDSLAEKGIRSVAKHRQNMDPNSREEKRFLKKNG